MQNSRIALNTIATYTQMVFTTILALFSSRWVLNTLGVIDYGLFCVVGAIILFITFFNNVMAGSVSRHFAYSIGQSNKADVNRWFNSAIGIHFSLALVLISIGWPIGEYVICHFLSIHISRLDTCLLIFRISLISAFVSMLSVPFVAMFTAQQHIIELAVWSTLQSIMTFILAWILRYASGDLLIIYSSGMVIILVLVQVAQMLRAITVFEECNIIYKQWFDGQRFKVLFSFAGWNLFVGAGLLFRDQGSTILLNHFFGPSVNAAFGIAKQVSAQANQLSAAMVGALSPEITVCAGSGDRTRMLVLSKHASKFGTILVIFLAIPLLTEMDYILKVWLFKPPQYTVLFCQLVLGTFLIERLSVGYMLAVQAHGKIAAYQATLGTCLFLTLPLAWLFIKTGFPPTSIGIAFIITMIIISIGRVLWGRYLLKMSIRYWVTTIFWPSTIVFLITTAAALVPHVLLSPTLLRLILVTVTSFAFAFLATWLLALDNKEREFFGAKGKQLLKKLGVGNKNAIKTVCNDISNEIK